jgi:hypothetical protein
MDFTIEYFNKTIAALARSQARSTKLVGDACLMALYFANVKGDAGAATALVNILRKSMKQQGIIALLEAHGNLAWTTQGKKKPCFEIFDAGHTAEEWEEVKGELRELCSDWESFKPAKEEAEEYDMLAAIDRIVKKAESEKEKKHAVRGEALIATLRKLVARTTGEEIDAVLRHAA